MTESRTRLAQHDRTVAANDDGAASAPARDLNRYLQSVTQLEFDGLDALLDASDYSL